MKCLCDSRVWKIAPFARWYSMTTSRCPNTHSPRNARQRQEVGDRAGLVLSLRRRQQIQRVAVQQERVAQPRADAVRERLRPARIVDERRRHRCFGPRPARLGARGGLADDAAAPCPARCRFASPPFRSEAAFPSRGRCGRIPRTAARSRRAPARSPADRGARSSSGAALRAAIRSSRARSTAPSPCRRPPTTSPAAAA